MAKTKSKSELEKLKGYAQILYTKEHLSQKEIAERTDISEKTIGKWVADGNWDKYKKNFVLTRQEMMGDLLNEVTEINKAIKDRPEGLRFADSKTADVRRKLILDIKQLETSASKPEAISACAALLEFVRKVSLAKAQELAPFVDGYIKSIL